MISSMTGYGKAVEQLEAKKITVEIRSLNSKGLELNVRIPVNHRDKELLLRKKLSNTLQRGKVDISLNIENTDVDNTVTINKPMVQKYITELSAISPANSDTLLEVAMRLPEAIKTTVEEPDDNEWHQIENTVDLAVEQLLNFRLQEGKALLEDFIVRLANIRQYLDLVIKLDKDRKNEQQSKLRKAIEDLKSDIDENRFEQELIYYLEKLDITEEIVRLTNHLDYFIDNLQNETSNGKKLTFISQEMGREINTIGSKANYAPMQKQVIKMKDELEKIKEQLSNVL